MYCFMCVLLFWGVVGLVEEQSLACDSMAYIYVWPDGEACDVMQLVAAFPS